MLIALTAMALHSDPTDQILYPYMHPNTAQISRWWVAKTIISDEIDVSPFVNRFASHCNGFESLHIEAVPFDLAHLPLIPSSQDSIKKTDSHISQPPRQASSSDTSHFPTHTRVRKVMRPVLSPTPFTIRDSDGTKSTSNDISQLNCVQKPKRLGQQQISLWAAHRPFIPGISYNKSSHLPNSPYDPMLTFVDHLIPFGTPIKYVDPTKTL